jgi:hypothetical protein
MIGKLTDAEMAEHVAQAEARAAQMEATRAALTKKYMAQGMSREKAEDMAFQEEWAKEEAKIRANNASRLAASRLPASSNNERAGGRRKTKRRHTKRRKSKARRKAL